MGFIGDNSVAMVLGDKIIASCSSKKRLKDAMDKARTGKGATFGYYVDDSEWFEIVEFSENGKTISKKEKPVKLKNSYCVTYVANFVVESLVWCRRKEMKVAGRSIIFSEISFCGNW